MADVGQPFVRKLEAVNESARVPITLVTGFLGAGKTSRLNAALVTGGQRIAVIENEIGSLGVDTALIANTHDDGVIELTNGCLCCSAEIDLVDTLEALARRRVSQPFERVIIETTGLADIGPVVSLLSDPEDPLAQDFHFDGVVTIVDAMNFKSWAGSTAESEPTSHPITSRTTGFGGSSMDAGLDDLTDSRLRIGRASAVAAFWKQVALADYVIISKGDLVDEEAAGDVEHAVASANPLAEVVLDRAFAAEAWLPVPSVGGHRHRAPTAARHSDTVLCGATEAKKRRGLAHLSGIDVLTMRLPLGRPMRRALLIDFATRLLEGGGVDGEAWRIKGLVAIEGNGTMLLQGVADQISLDEWSREVDVPCLVIIGAGFHREAIEAALLSCTAEQQPQLADTSAQLKHSDELADSS